MPATMYLDQTQHLVESQGPHNTDVLYEKDLHQFEAHAFHGVGIHRYNTEAMTQQRTYEKTRILPSLYTGQTSQRQDPFVL